MKTDAVTDCLLAVLTYIRDHYAGLTDDEEQRAETEALKDNIMDLLAGWDSVALNAWLNESGEDPEVK